MTSIVGDMYGPGTSVDKSFTPVPQECARLLEWLAGITPGFTKDLEALENVRFEGEDLPSIPGPVKSVALSAVLHAMAGIVGQEISEIRGHKPGQLKINTDHSGLWLGTPILVTLNDRDANDLIQSGEVDIIVPVTDKGCFDTPLRFRGWAIHKTKTPDTWYQIHTSLAPGPVFEAIGIDPKARDINTNDEAYAHIQAAVERYEARELEMIFRERGLCGVTCFTPKAWRETEMGIALARHPAIDYKKQTYIPDTPPVAFSKTADKRPLAGIKVVELGRVITTPALCAGLGAFGADIVRIMSPHALDIYDLQITLTVGKRECSLDLDLEYDRKQLWALLEEADVVVQGYRKGALERKGFGLTALLEMATRRGKGIIYIDENCFGPDGIYAEVPGWEQIADAASGCCYVMGKAYGFPEGTGVLPSLPIADLSAGAVGIVTTLLAIRDRALHGGSYYGHVAITAFQAVSLLPEVGLYQPEIVRKLQENRENFFAEFKKTAFGDRLRILAPVVKYANKGVSPRWVSAPRPFRSDKEVRFRGEE
ncbi:MAG: hypothetical protein ASARMPRED_006678 [Alectoria sarmentosa]|nr:MAG: hypothetical protein ASARMPRED_006678 [Alectoria sarmentosa]